MAPVPDSWMRCHQTRYGSTTATPAAWCHQAVIRRPHVLSDFNAYPIPRPVGQHFGQRCAVLYRTCVKSSNTPNPTSTNKRYELCYKLPARTLCRGTAVLGHPGRSLGDVPGRQGTRPTGPRVQASSTAFRSLRHRNLWVLHRCDRCGVSQRSPAAAPSPDRAVRCLVRGCGRPRSVWHCRARPEGTPPMLWRCPDRGAADHDAETLSPVDPGRVVDTGWDPVMCF